MSQSLSDAPRPSQALAPSASLSVELVGDVICPFTYLGKRRLDRAIRHVEGPTSLGWYPFQLNPDMPAAGESFTAYIRTRFGSIGAIQPVFDRLRAEGQALGIEFRFDRLSHVPNTMPAHQVLKLASELDLELMPILDRLLAAYLTEGLDIGDTAVLAELLHPFGLDAQRVAEAVSDKRLRESVCEMEQHIRETGLTGVPGFLMNRQLLLVGAQEVDGIVEGFDRAMFGDADGQELKAPLH